MDSFQWMFKLAATFTKKEIKALNPDQVAEVEQIVRQAMEDAWDVGNGLDHGVRFDMSWMTTGKDTER